MENPQWTKNDEVRFYVRYNPFKESLSMETIAITNLRKKLYEALQEVIGYNQPLLVTTKKGNAVILSEEDYNGLQETLTLLGQPGFLEQIKTAQSQDPKDRVPWDGKDLK